MILGIWGTWPVRWALIGPTRYVVPLFTYGERELGESVMGGFGGPTLPTQLLYVLGFSETLT